MPRAPAESPTEGSGGDLRTVLGRVTEAIRRGQANVVVHQTSVDSGGDGDAAERLVQLKQLRDQGLITAADYEAKKAEILSRL